MVDNTHVVIGSFEPDDDRSVRLRVAGPAALLTAKGIKMAERLELAETEPHRVKNKDARALFPCSLQMPHEATHRWRRPSPPLSGTCSPLCRDHWLGTNLEPWP